MSLGIAFDIGAYECKAAIIRGEGLEPAKLDQETSIFSVAYVDKNGNILVGKKAEPYIEIGSARVITNAKRRIIEGKKDLPGIPGVSYIDIYVALIKETLETHNRRLQENGDGSIERIVLTVPSFPEERSEVIAEMKRAAESIDIGDGKKLSVDILIEPAGVGIYNLDSVNKKEAIESTGKKHTQIIYDLGHSTLDVALVASGYNDSLAYDLHFFRSDDTTFCEYFDMRIVEEMENFLSENGYNIDDLSGREKAMLRNRARGIKHALSEKDECIESLEIDDDFVEFTLTRERFEELIGVCIKNSTALITDAIEEAEEKGLKVDEIVLAGGGSKIPFVERYIKEIAGDIPVKCSLRPIDAVSFGAARYALSRNLIQRAKYSYGIELPGVSGTLDRNICLLTKADVTLPFKSEKLSEVKLRCNADGVFNTALYSYNGKSETAVLPEAKCDQTRCMSFEITPGKEVDLCLEIDEEHCVKVICETSEGERFVMTSFDPADAVARKEK